MTAPGPSQPWQQPTAPQPPLNPKRRRTNAIILGVTGVLVLCCGGVAAIGAFTGDEPVSKDVAVEQTVAPRLAAPITSTTPQATEAATTTPTRTRATQTPTKTKPSPSKKPSPKATTRKPKPKPKPTATKDPIREGVRAGAFCAPAGAMGRTSKGKLMRCKSTTADDRNRWRAA